MLEKQFLLLPKQTLMMMAIFLLKLPTSCAGKLTTTPKMCSHSLVYIKLFRKKLGYCCWSFLSGLMIWRLTLHCLWIILTSCVLKFILVQLDLSKIKTWGEKCLSHCLRSFIDFPYVFSLCCVKQTTTRKKKLRRSILLECIQNAFLCLSKVTVPILTRKKIVSFVCFGTLLDCLCGSDIFLI